jgi:predicted anti-sigma-YlaC factor YlaD
MTDCPREQETLDLVRAGRWPDGCDDETRAHVASCSLCRESVQIASLLTDDYRAAVRTARVPTSGLVWWRVQRRAREEAARNAARVVTLVQGICVVIGVAVALGIVGAQNLSRAFSFAPNELFNAATLSQWSLPILLALMVWLTLAPVAVYLAVSRD